MKSENEEPMTIDQVLTNLKIISQIKKGEKIISSNNILEIDTRYFQFARRWWEVNSRISTLELFNKIVERSFNLIDETYNNKSKENYYFSEENSRTLQKFSIELTNVCNGLNNLKETYSDDVTTTSQLDVMLDKIGQRIEKIQKIFVISDTNSKKDNYMEKEI